MSLEHRYAEMMTSHTISEDVEGHVENDDDEAATVPTLKEIATLLNEVLDQRFSDLVEQAASSNSLNKASSKDEKSVLALLELVIRRQEATKQKSITVEHAIQKLSIQNNPLRNFFTSFLTSSVSFALVLFVIFYISNR